jgi:carbamoyltransferase
MRYCGYSEFMHDAGLAFLDVDGNIVYASHGERYSKMKNDPVLPDIMYDMISPTDHVTFYEDPDIRHAIPRYKGGHKNRSTMETNVLYESVDYDDFVEHHVSHAANGFFTRPWESEDDTVILSLDGAGEEQSMVIYDHNFNIIDQWFLPKSLGYWYGNATKQLGFRILEEEYIVMGMAAYGNPVMGEKMYEEFLNQESRSLKHGGNQLSNKKFTSYKDKFIEWHNKIGDQDFAASIQYMAEKIIMDLALFCRKFGSKLIFTGGCAQNIVACSQIRPLFDDMWVPIAPTDAGSALGAAAYSWGKATGKSRINWEGPYLGHKIDRQINPREVVDHLLKYKYCGVANGRAEFGPRALGNRSLIADVRTDVKDTVNTIKRRQKFRPFAPAILEEYADQYFSGPMNEYMQYTSKALHDYKSVIHVDGTSRVQIVRKDCKSVLRQILEEYYEKTGVPMLLNTSLNIRGMPIVNDEKDANDFESLYGVKVF